MIISIQNWYNICKLRKQSKHQSSDSQSSNPYRLVLNLTDKTNLQKLINMLHYQILVSVVLEKIFKKSYKRNKFRILAVTWNKEIWIIW